MEPWLVDRAGPILSDANTLSTESRVPAPEFVGDVSIVTVMLLDGDREGAVLAERPGYAGQGFTIPRIGWHRALAHPLLEPLLAQPGVYILDRRSDDASRRRLYIGHAELLRSRLETHLASPKKSWWTRVHGFAGGLDLTATSWLEAELIAAAKAAHRSEVTNGPTPTRPQLGWAAEQTMAQQYQRARLLLGVLGIDSFDPKEPPPPPRGDYPPLTGRDVYLVVGESPGYWRHLEDWARFGFVSGGGSASITSGMDKIKAGDRLFAYLSGHGYVGVAVAVADAAPIDQVELPMQGRRVAVLALGVTDAATPLWLDDRSLTERVVPVRWMNVPSREAAFFGPGIFHSPRTTCTLRDRTTARRVLEHFGLSDSGYRDAERAGGRG